MSAAVAYVKFLEGPDKGKKKTISTSKFKNKVNIKDFDKNKKYLIQYKDDIYYKVQIIFIEDNDMELESKVKNVRPKLLPSSKLDTETEDESNNKPKNSKSIAGPSTSHNSAESKDRRLKKYATLLNIKTEKLSSLINNESNKTTENLATSINTKNNKTTENKINYSCSTLSVLNNDNEIAIKDMNDIRSKENVAAFDTEDPLETAEQNEGAFEIKEQLKLSEDAKGEQQDAKTKARSDKSLEIKSDVGVHVPEVCQAKIRKLEKQLAELKKNKKDKSELKKENEKLKKKYTDVKKKLEEEKIISQTYKDQNTKLVEKVIEKFEEKEIIKEQMEKSNDGGNIINNLDHRKNFLPVGYARPSENKVHIGRNVFLSIKEYNYVMAAKSPAQCVGNAILQVFGEDMLLKSTVTGNISNKSIGGNKRKGKVIEEKVQKLDEILLFACQELFIHWLQTSYKVIKPEVEELKEISKFYTYVSKKISYLKRPATKTLCKENNEEVESSENGDPEQNNTVMNKVLVEKNLNLQGPSQSSKNKEIEFVKVDFLENNVESKGSKTLETDDKSVNEEDSGRDYMSDISEKIPSISSEDSDPLATN